MEKVSPLLICKTYRTIYLTTKLGIGKMEMGGNGNEEMEVK